MPRQLTVFAMIVLAALLSSGCKPKQSDDSDDHKHSEDVHTEEHASEGPHGGHLIELGKEEYHAELTHDDANKSVTIYLLDSSAKSAVPIESEELTLNMVLESGPVQFKMAASPQDSDPEGQSSRFVSSDEQLFESLESEEASGRFNVSIKGKSYTGNVEHHDHEGENHKEEN